MNAKKRGLGRAKPQYTPHVTMLYDERGIEDHAIEPVCWTVRDFALSRLRADPDPGRAGGHTRCDITGVAWVVQ